MSPDFHNLTGKRQFSMSLNFLQMKCVYEMSSVMNTTNTNITSYCKVRQNFKNCKTCSLCYYDSLLHQTLHLFNDYTFHTYHSFVVNAIQKKNRKKIEH